MQFKTLMRLVIESEGQDGLPQVTISRQLFRTLLIGALRNKGEFDEKFYVALNPDIRDAIKSQTIASAADHYYNSGYFEGRFPSKFLVDEKYYLEHNPDVAAAIKAGIIKNAQEHFEFAGFDEGRSPYKGFSLF